MARPLLLALAAASLLALATALLAPAPRAALAVDCGELPRGKNPSPDEIGRAMEELSFSFGIPTEIMKGVAFQESGVQQWRPDGSFVHNVTDCGLGMMQLTGSTAEEFDVERLKTDWRYNLEAGVKVLQSKWQRVLRERWKGKDLPAPDAAILENWYYALSYYQGKRTGEYPGKVLSHIAKRPGVLAKLLPKAVPVSNPEAVLPGFSYGTGYTALAGDRFVLEGKKEVKAPTHKGTIGDPALLEKLDAVLAAAEKALAAGDARRAIRLFQVVIRTKADSGAAKKAEAAVASLSAKAQEGIATGKAAEEAEDWAGAIVAYEAVERAYTGLPEADEAGARADAIRGDPRLKEAAARIESERGARFLLAKGEAAKERGDSVEALRLYRKAAAEFPATAGGADAANRVRLLESDEAVMAEVRRREQARLLREWLAAGEAYMENGLTDRAVASLKRVLEAAPGTAEAEKAKRLIAEAERRRGE
jgi:tetratricopeptide (TPR) repeat protein